MKTTDLRLVETGDGGDLVLRGNDVEMISGLQNMPYIAMFGGNPEQSTVGAKNTEQAFDFWGNFLINPNDQPIWFNSLTERLLDTISLSPITRIEIQETVKKDLEFILKFAQVSVEVFLISVDRIRIEIKIQEPDNLSSELFKYIWDATQQELQEIPTTGLPLGNQNMYINNDYIDDYFI